MSGYRATDWCIVQTSSAGTLALASALNDAGIEAWTPIGIAVKRMGKTRDRVEQTVPLMPTFAFARYHSLPDVLAMAHAPAPVYQVWDKEQRRMVMRGRPFFRVFRHGHIYPAVSDRDLDKLRLAERQGRPIEHVRIFKPGEAVRLGAGSGFEGLIGEISEVKGNYAFVRFSLFGTHPTVKVNARSLLSAA